MDRALRDRTSSSQSISVLAFEGDVVPGGGSAELVIAWGGVVALRPGMPVCGTGSNFTQAVMIPWQ